MALSSKHLLSIQDLNREDIKLICSVAKSFQEINTRAIKKLPTLRGRIVINLFLEPSTRTRSSFEIAAKRLSADAINMSGSALSTTKGESLIDTAETLNAMASDAIILRHSFAGAANLLASRVDGVVINGGDGKHQHPSQTLLDIYTMKENLGSLEGKTVGIVGDIAHSRVAGSLAPALYELGAHPVFIAPATLLPSRPELLGAEASYELDEALPELDVIYLLRVQKERFNTPSFPSFREYSNLYCLNKERLKHVQEDALIMHPGPINRGVELDADILGDERVKILDQVTAGVAVRMALLYLLLGGDPHGTAS